MRPIPPKLKKEMASDPYYEQCCISRRRTEKIDWHHNLIYAGRQVNEKWCILPLATSIHKNIEKYKEQCDWIMVNRATDSDLQRFSKVVDLKLLKDRLNTKYGVYNIPRELLQTKN
jgi:hypothetical protein